MKILILAITIFLISTAGFADNKDGSDFRFRPIGLLVGAIGLDYDIALSENWTLGPEIQYWHLRSNEASDFTSKYDIIAWGIGARANWFANGKFTDGLYVGPSLGYANFKVTTTDSNGDVSGSSSAMLAGCLVGYGWFWDSFNQMLGGGVNIALGSASVNIMDASGNSTSVSTSIAGLAIEYSLGWTF
jgi:Protein of unknown function (DUF3575)